MQEQGDNYIYDAKSKFTCKNHYKAVLCLIAAIILYAAACAISINLIFKAMNNTCYDYDRIPAFISEYNYCNNEYKGTLVYSADIKCKNSHKCGGYKYCIDNTVLNTTRGKILFSNCYKKYKNYFECSCQNNFYKFLIINFIILAVISGCYFYIVLKIMKLNS